MAQAELFVVLADPLGRFFRHKENDEDTRIPRLYPEIVVVFPA